MNNTVEKDFFWISPELTGEMDKAVRVSCQIFSGFNVPRIIKIG